MALFWFILGTVLGSFYLVYATRVPKGKNFINSRSKCDHCGYILKWYNLIPLFSFIIQSGKCCKCGKKISSEHFFVELFTGLLFLLSYIYFKNGFNFYVALVVVSLMVVIFISDFKYMVILDSSLVTSCILVLILMIIYKFSFKAICVQILSGLILFLVMFLVERVGTFTLKKDSLGGGDIKLTFVLGFILGIKAGIVALVLSSFLALPYAIATLYLKDNHEFAYGPFIAGALFIVFFHLDKFNMLIDYVFIL